MPTRPLTIKQRKALNGEKEPEKRPNSAKRGYDHRWRAFRKLYLGRNPLCVLHQQRGETVAGVVVDHIIPHRGNKELFWDVNNLQTLCIRCHNAKSATEK